MCIPEPSGWREGRNIHLLTLLHIHVEHQLMLSGFPWAFHRIVPEMPRAGSQRLTVRCNEVVSAKWVRTWMELISTAVAGIGSESQSPWFGDTKNVWLKMATDPFTLFPMRERGILSPLLESGQLPNIM